MASPLERIIRRRRQLEAAGQQSFFAPAPLEFPAPEPAPPPLRVPAPVQAGPPLRVGILGSGSGGNAVVVESGDRRILIDAGFSCRELARRMALLDVDPKSIAAVVLTHEHQDHCRGVDGFAKRYKVPVLATAGTREGAGLREDRFRSTVLIRSGEPREVAGFVIEPFLIPHDAAEPVGFVVEDPCGRRLGLVADVGCRTSLAWGRLRDLDVLVLETNHDLDMLRNGPYPWSLKQRVAGRHGHLSNREAAEGLPELMGGRLSWVVLYHLSRTNNLPALAAAAIGEALDREGCPARLAVTEQDHPTPWLEV
ncbi:MAG: MBL fold metallo-hydrolase [Acidobacteria bacterium]|nr:MBL fold metallo-hydrolase [Acidobacteriota bacterium]